jgi:hypothetical protein
LNTYIEYKFKWKKGKTRLRKGMAGNAAKEAKAVIGGQ